MTGSKHDHPLIGCVSKPEGTKAGDELPVAVILPRLTEANGAEKYEKQRTTQVATDAGFVGFVANVYLAEIAKFEGENPDVASWSAELTYHEDVPRYPNRILTAIDPDRIAIAGFGFGGAEELCITPRLTPSQSSRGGVDPVARAVAGFHGEISGVMAGIEKVLDDPALATLVNCLAEAGGCDDLDGGSWPGAAAGGGSEGGSWPGSSSGGDGGGS